MRFAYPPYIVPFTDTPALALFENPGFSLKIPGELREQVKTGA